jgi:antitoxin HicB
MKARNRRKTIDHSDSTFDSFLDREGIREEAEAVATKRVLAWQLEQAMQQQKKTKQAMAKQLRTSRSQLDRLLDPQNVSVTQDTITRAARALGKRVIMRVADVKAKRVEAMSLYSVMMRGRRRIEKSKPATLKTTTVRHPAICHSEKEPAQADRRISSESNA